MVWAILRRGGFGLSCLLLLAPVLAGQTRQSSPPQTASEPAAAKAVLPQPPGGRVAATAPLPLQTPPPQAMLLTGKVVEVNDGNTITLLAGKELYEIRLAGIDAPERDQPAGPAALEALSHKVLDKTVRVLSLDNGHLKKFRGVVYFNGCVNTEMVREGMAWYDPQSGQSLWLADAERQARQARQGVWAETNPTPPWEWLRAKAAKDQPPPADPPAKPAPSKRSRVARKAGESPIASDQATAPGNAASPPAPSAAAKPAAAPGQWWLTEGTNTRHNPTCRRYYMKTKGRFCGPDEGQPCRLCGG